MTPGLGAAGWPGIGGQFGAGRRPSCGRRSVTGARYGRRPIRSPKRAARAPATPMNSTGTASTRATTRNPPVGAEPVDDRHYQRDASRGRRSVGEELGVALLLRGRAAWAAARVAAGGSPLLLDRVRHRGTRWGARAAGTSSKRIGYCGRGVFPSPGETFADSPRESAPRSPLAAELAVRFAGRGAPRAPLPAGGRLPLGSP